MRRQRGQKWFEKNEHALRKGLSGEKKRLSNKKKSEDVCMCECMCVYIFMRMCIYICMHVDITCVHIYAHMYVYLCMHVCAYVCV